MFLSKFKKKRKTMEQKILGTFFIKPQLQIVIRTTIKLKINSTLNGYSNILVAFVKTLTT